MTRTLLALSLSLVLARAAGASGYAAYLDGATCVNADGVGCTRTGTDHQRGVMRCVAGTAGTFDCPLAITAGASTALTVAPAAAEIVNVSGTASGNVCYAITTYVTTSGTNTTAAMVGGTKSAVISASVGALSCTGVEAACVLGGAAAVAAYDVHAAGGCAGSMCTDKQAWVRVSWEASCAGAVATGSYDFPFLAVGVQ
jgi:hypothetical protein